MTRQQLELWSASPAAAISAAPYLLGRENAAPNLVLVHSLTALDQDAQRCYLDNARATRTRIAYERDWRAFTSWCAEHELTALPASPSSLARYLTQLAQRGRKMSTIRRARIAIGVVHANAGAERPDRDPRIRTLERGIGKTLGTREEGARPLLLEDLSRMMGVLGARPRDDRDRALLLIGFWGALRGGELAALRIEHLRLHETGLSVFLERSKEDICAQGKTVEIARASTDVLCAVRATERWSARLPQQEGPLLRRVAGDHVRDEAIAGRAIARIVTRAARAAGLDHPDEYSAHSLRAGRHERVRARCHRARDSRSRSLERPAFARSLHPAQCSAWSPKRRHSDRLTPADSIPTARAVATDALWFLWSRPPSCQPS